MDKWIKNIGQLNYASNGGTIIVHNETSCVAPPALTTIPAPPEKLIGREKAIEEIQNLFTQHKIVYIHAYGGVGKTAVAMEIVNHVKKEIALTTCEYEHVAWITSTGDLNRDLISFNIPGLKEQRTIEERLSSVISYLQKNPTFIVIDNLDTPPSTQEVNIMNTFSGVTKVLITSRASIKKFHEYILQPLNLQEAVLLFYKHYLDISKVLDWSEVNNRTDIKYVYKIVDVSSNNALLIELISKMAYWEYSGRLDTLWERLEKDIFGTESEIDIEVDHHAEYNDRNILSKNDFKLQGHIRRLYKLSRLDKNKQELMKFISIFPAETVIFSDVFKWAGFELIDIKWLSDRGWLERNKGGYLIHVMVKGSVELQNNIKPIDIWKYECLIERLIDTNQYLSVEDGYLNIREKIIVPETVCKLIEESGKKDKRAFYPFYTLANVYFGQGDYEKAREYYGKALAIVEKSLGLNNSDIVLAYNGLALAYDRLGDYENALRYYQKAFVLNDEAIGTNNPDITATMYHNYAGVYYDKGDYKKALEYNGKAVSIREKVFGQNHPETAKSYNSIALVYKALGDYGNAIKYNLMTLVTREKFLGTNHPDTAITYNNLAVVLSDLGNYEKALEYFEKALAISERVLGKNHPETGMKYNNLGRVYFALEDYENAQKYFEKALSISEKAIGKNHPETEKIYYNLATVYNKQGEYEIALEYYEKVLAIRKRVFGLDHPKTTAMYEPIAQLYYAQNSYEKAIIYFMKDLTNTEKNLGKNHPDTVTAYNNLAVVYSAQSNYDKALEYFEKSLALSKKVYGPNHIFTATIYLSIANMYIAQGDNERALKYYNKSQEIIN